MVSLTYYPIDGGHCWNYWSSQLFGAWPKLVADLAGEDGDDSRYDLVEMFDADERSIEAVTCDGVVIGVLNEPVPANLSEYVTYEQLQTREAAE